MSKPRTMERKVRQRRKAKLAKLHEKFLQAKTQDAKERILAKAESVSPNIAKSQYATLWAK
jgi:hypothetical protein